MGGVHRLAHLMLDRGLAAALFPIGGIAGGDPYLWMRRKPRLGLGRGGVEVDVQTVRARLQMIGGEAEYFLRRREDRGDETPGRYGARGHQTIISFVAVSRTSG